jgi:hypothetical protein
VTSTLTDDPVRPASGAFWPVLLLSLAVLTTVWFQWQIVRKQRTQVAAKVAERQVAVTQGQEVVRRVEAFLRDFGGLADADAEARAIGAQHQIVPTGQPAPK